MRTSRLVFLSALFASSVLATGSDVQTSQESEVKRRKLYAEDANESVSVQSNSYTSPEPKPHHHPQSSSSTTANKSSESSSSTSSSSSANGGSSLSTSDSSSAAASSGTDGASSSAAASSGTDGSSSSSGSSGAATSSSSSSSSSSGSEGSSGGVGSSASGGGASPSSVSASVRGPTGTPAHKGTLVLLGVAAVAGVAIAAAFVPKRRVETPEHPLKGSLNRRINLFSNLAQHTSDPSARPPRRHLEDDSYVNADESMV